MAKTSSFESRKRKIIDGVRKCENKICGLFGKIEKKIVLESFGGKQYSDNPRAISEKMHELYPDYKIVWGQQGTERLLGAPEYVDVYPVHSLKYYRERATAVAYVRNEVMTGDLVKRKKQLFIQTWHGDRAFKKILYDSLDARGIPAGEYDFRDQELTDIFVIGSDFAEKRFKSAFRFTKPMLKVGCPRNDCLVNSHGADQIRAKLGIDKDTKILMYAPTLRRNTKVVKATVDLDETISHLERNGENWVCIVRAHPKSERVDVQAQKKIIDVSKYPDMSDLLMITDFLITDYSSSAGDFILRKKPIILAQFDLEQYTKDDRSFYIDIKDTGFLIARSQAELNEIVDSTSDEQYAEICENIMRFYGTCETGHSAEEVCRRINKHFQSI